MHFNFGPNDILGIVKRRFFWAAIPFLAICIVGLIVINKVPPTYKSVARLIVEDQQIKDDWVVSAVTSDALQRLHAVATRVQARDSLLQLASDANLFADQRLSSSQVAERMKKNVEIVIQRTESRRTWGNGPSTITISIAYLSKDPAESQRVTNLLLSSFINRSIEIRSEIAGDTTTFLKEEEIKLRSNLDSVVDRISSIKLENPKSLPENRDLYERQLERAVTEQARLDLLLEQSRQELRIVQMQRPLLLDTSQNGSRAEVELNQMRRELSSLQRNYQDTYPDVVAMKQAVLALERDVDPAAYRVRARNEINALNTRISALEEGSRDRSYLEQERDRLQQELNETPTNVASSSPSVVQYNAQIASLEARIETLGRQRSEVTNNIAGFEERLNNVPAVEAQLYRLEQERIQLERDLTTLRSNRSQAERSESLEEQAKAERFSILEQPLRPEEPVSPNKPVLAVMLVALAGGLSLVIALFPEVFFARIYNKNHVEQILPGIKIMEVPKFRSKEPQTVHYAVIAMCSISTLGLGVGLAWTAFKTLL